MYTYQDLLQHSKTEEDKRAFILLAIDDHKRSAAYHTAVDAEQYYSKRNVTISRYQKFLRTLTGRQVPDTFSANYKLKSQMFRRFVTQQTQYVLANGVTFNEEGTKEALGATFDTRLQALAKKAMIDGVAFGFWNFNHLEVFGYADTPTSAGFVPFYDERTSLLMSGIRYWYTGTADKLATHATLYELDGYTDYVSIKSEPLEEVNPKRGYIKTSTITGELEEIYYSNYKSFPIVPMYANDLHESELIGLREYIDAYDFLSSNLCSDIDDTSGFYWVIKGASGMDDIDLAQFIERIKTVRATVLDEDNAAAEAHTYDVPVDSRAKMLDILKHDMYEDFQLLNVSDISAGNKTATEIRAAYQSQDDKCSAFEYEIIEFIQGILNIVGINDYPSFRWNKVVNERELVESVMMAAQYLDDETILSKLPFLSQDEIDGILDRKAAEDLSRFGAINTKPVDDQEQETEDDVNE